jgi:rRNA processing protein Gar1
MMVDSNSRSVPTIGALVYSADGDELGKVKEVAGSAFKVDAAMEPDYWLSSEYISSATESEVRPLGYQGRQDIPAE